MQSPAPSGSRIPPLMVDAGFPAGVSGAAVTSGTDTTTSSTYVNMAGTGSQTSFSFTKRFANTRIFVMLAMDVYTTSSTATGYAGVLINGTDYDLTSIPTSVTANRVPQTGFRFISGIAAGTYTVQARWRRSSGTGVYTRDVAGWLSLMAWEVAG